MFNNNMNIQAEFIDYLRDNNLLLDADINKTDSQIDIQKYSDDLKTYLQQQYGAEADLVANEIEDINDFNLDDDELEADETQKTDKTQETEDVKEIQSLENDIIQDIDGDTFSLSDYGCDGASQLEKINSAITGEGLKAKRDEIASALEKMQADMDGIDSKISSTQAALDKAESDLKLAISEIERYERLLAQEEDKLEKTQQEYEKNTKEHEQTANEISDLDKTMGGINEKISSYTSQLEADTQNAQKEAMWDAMNSYDETKDGSWDSYIGEKMSEIAPDGRLSGLIETLSGASSSAVKQMAGLQLSLGKLEKSLSTNEKDMTNSAALIKDYSTQIVNNQNLKATSEADIETNSASLATLKEKKEKYPAQIETLSAQLKDYDSMIERNIQPISDCEMQFIEQSNVNLSEKLPDGSPRYVIAPGDSDNRLHVYDMANDGYAIVRQFAPDGGYDIIPNGNGHLNDLSLKEDGEGASSKPVFSLDDCDNVSYDNGCYCTSSPLSFDIDGDGVNTSDEIVKFDIDGDGKVDNIYDSDDAVLVFDADGDGISGESGLEVFGDNTDLDGDGKADGFSDGFAALKALAKKEGLISENDSDLSADDMKVLEEKYGLGIKTGGYNSQTQSLADVGITQINLSKTDETTLIDNFDGKGNQLMTQEGATFIMNGEEHEYADLRHRKVEASSKNYSGKSKDDFDFSNKDDISKMSSNLTFKFNSHSSTTNEYSSIAKKALNNAQVRASESNDSIDKINEYLRISYISQENIEEKSILQENEIKQDDNAVYIIVVFFILLFIIRILFHAVS